MGGEASTPDHKRLLLLGLLRDGPRHGYELHQIVRAHGALYADLGRANIYYLLDRMAGEGLVSVTSEPGARGNRGVRIVYRLTAAGRRRFSQLLRAQMLAYEPVHTGVDVAVVLLSAVSPGEALRLLRARRDAVAARRTQVAADLGAVADRAALARIAADHLLSLIDAELAWIDRSVATLHANAPGARRSGHTD